ncbi:MAG: alpha/beta fold hydrolase [Bdellovibrionales bacterium]|nr:alpha/beta fold hydrolase [Bdellovibrionales bacterium]
MNLVLLHGFGGGPENWGEFQSLLGWHGSVQALTLPGHGGKDVISLEAWLGGTEIPENSVVLGYSMGGRLATLLAEKQQRAGRPLRGLILVSSGLGVSADRAQRAQEDAAWAALLRADSTAFWHQWYAQEIFRSFREGNFSGKSRWLILRGDQDAGRLAAALESFGPAAHRPLERVLAGQIGCPLLYIAGESDKKYAAVASRVRELVPAARVRIITGAGHVIPVEAPAELARAVKDFVTLL